ncbi:MAG: InlB B-repeat-containing protein [Clostridia bacterium]|nr:InlB B-repeat-containing protein [Clostridia bacterium]
MKNKIIRLALCLVLVFSTLLLSSCDVIDELISKIGGAENDNDMLTCVEQSNFTKSSNSYRVKDSFSLEGGSDYYIFELGVVDYVPMNISNPEGVYFDGKDMTLEFNYKETNYEESARLIENSIETSVELTTATYVEGSVSGPLSELLEAGLTVGVENSVTSGISTTFTESFYNAVSKETTFEKNVTYKMSRKDPKGYYFYVPVASMKVYEVVVYNPDSKNVEYMFTYSQFGEALPGLYYSPTSFLDMAQYNISFDEHKIPILTPPSKVVERDVTVALDPQGASCDVNELQLEIGSTYGELPELEKKGYTFAGWECNGALVNSESMVISSKPLVAKWDIITTCTRYINETIEVSSTNKLNPLYIFVTGSNGESSSNSTGLMDIFDFEQLKKDGYKLRIVFESDVKHGVLAIKGLKYNVLFTSNGSTFETLSDGIKSTDYITRSMVSDLISLNNINGNINFTVTTENVVSLYMKNIKIKFEFVK